MPTGKREVGATTEAVAAEIRVLAARRRINQGEVATKAGIPASTMSKLWHGQRPFDVEQLARVCAALDAEPSEIIARAEAALQSAGLAEAAYDPPATPGGEEVQP